jgi:hypothetical protein
MNISNELNSNLKNDFVEKDLGDELQAKFYKIDLNEITSNNTISNSNTNKQIHFQHYSNPISQIASIFKPDNSRYHYHKTHQPPPLIHIPKLINSINPVYSKSFDDHYNMIQNSGTLNSNINVEHLNNNNNNNNNNMLNKKLSYSGSKELSNWNNYIMNEKLASSNNNTLKMGNSLNINKLLLNSANNMMLTAGTAIRNHHEKDYHEYLLDKLIKKQQKKENELELIKSYLMQNNIIEPNYSSGSKLFLNQSIHPNPSNVNIKSKITSPSKIAYSNFLSKQGQHQSAYQNMLNSQDGGQLHISEAMVHAASATANALADNNIKSNSYRADANKSKRSK